MMRSYKLTPERRMMFQQMYLMWRLQNPNEHFPILLGGELGILEPLFADLMAKGLVTLANAEYVITNLGTECLTKFHERYIDYLKMYDIYCAVDLGTGEFAFQMLLGLTSEQFKIFLNQERWEDLRIAVAVYKGLDPLEIVFMSFLNEGRFAKNGLGWTIDLMGDFMWDEMLRICNTALHPEDLGTSDVIEDVINQGSNLMVQLLMGAQEAQTGQAIVPTEQQPQYETITTTETVTYVEEVQNYGYNRWGYAPTYDYCYVTSPLYIAPCWGVDYWYW